MKIESQVERLYDICEELEGILLKYERITSDLKELILQNQQIGLEINDSEFLIHCLIDYKDIIQSLIKSRIEEYQDISKEVEEEHYIIRGEEVTKKVQKDLTQFYPEVMEIILGTMK